MWNIRSHARRFPVHTGTLTPSIAHPNRFLNHLKRFSAGFLTFRGWKIKNCTVSGDKTNDFECAPGSWPALSVKPYRACQLSQRESPWHDGKVSGQTITLSGFARGSLFEGTVARSAAEGVIQVRTPSVIAARCHLPHGGRHWQYTKASGQTAKPSVSPEPLPLGEVSPQVTERVHAVRNSPSHLALLDASPLWDGALDMAGKLPDKLQSFRHARGSLFEGAGKTVRF